jgi:hypothetical protein
MIAMSREGVHRIESKGGLSECIDSFRGMTLSTFKEAIMQKIERENTYIFSSPSKEISTKHGEERKATRLARSTKMLLLSC